MVAALTSHGTLHSLDYVVVGVYILAILAVGSSFSRKRQNAEEYLLGDRSILWWVAGISYLMTLLSTVSMVGVPGGAYAHGITLAIQNVILPFIAIGAFHLFIRFYFRARMFTPFDYLERRFAPRVRALAAGFYWFERLIYLGLVLYATAVIFEGACGWPKIWTILLTAGVAVAYTLLGGLKAVAWTELVQFVIIVAGMGVLFQKILRAVPGGAIGVLQYAFAHDRGMPELNDPTFYSLSPFYRMTLWGLVLFVVNEQLFFNKPHFATVNKKGELFVSDTFNARIQKFSPDGKFIKTWGQVGDGPGQSLQNGYLARLGLDGQGFLYVREFDGGRIQKYTEDGEYVATFSRRGVETGELDEGYGLPGGNALYGNGHVTWRSFSEQIEMVNATGFLRWY